MKFQSNSNVSKFGAVGIGQLALGQLRPLIRTAGSVAPRQASRCMGRARSPRPEIRLEISLSVSVATDQKKGRRRVISFIAIIHSALGGSGHDKQAGSKKRPLKYESGRADGRRTLNDSFKRPSFRTSNRLRSRRPANAHVLYACSYHQISLLEKRAESQSDQFGMDWPAAKMTR